MVRLILKKHGYPPDLREEATRTVLEQAKVLCAEWGRKTQPHGLRLFPPRHHAKLFG